MNSLWNLTHFSVKRFAISLIISYILKMNIQILLLKIYRLIHVYQLYRKTNMTSQKFKSQNNIEAGALMLC